MTMYDEHKLFETSTAINTNYTNLVYAFMKSLFEKIYVYTCIHHIFFWRNRVFMFKRFYQGRCYVECTSFCALLRTECDVCMTSSTLSTSQMRNKTKYTTFRFSLSTTFALLLSTVSPFESKTRG